MNNKSIEINPFDVSNKSDNKKSSEEFWELLSRSELINSCE